MFSLCSRQVSRQFARQFHVSAMAPVAVGDKVPNVTLFEDSPGGKVELAALCAGKKVVMFGVPGAFTPGCSKTHLPGRGLYYFWFQKMNLSIFRLRVCRGGSQGRRS